MATLTVVPADPFHRTRLTAGGSPLPGGGGNSRLGPGSPPNPGGAWGGGGPWGLGHDAAVDVPPKGDPLPRPLVHPAEQLQQDAPGAKTGHAPPFPRWIRQFLCVG